jgi:hypothetical protein
MNGSQNLQVNGISPGGQNFVIGADIMCQSAISLRTVPAGLKQTN